MNTPLTPLKRGIKKTGLAKRMRVWMREQKQIFTWQELLICVDIPGGPEKKTIYSALNDFIKRGEVIKGEDDYTYQYNHTRKPHGYDGRKQRILKAIYVSNSRFTASDIQRISGAPQKVWVTEIIRNLRSRGYVTRVSRRKNHRGVEREYAVTSRDRFRMEIL